MSEPVDPTAPAQPADAPSAALSTAIEQNDVRAYRETRRAERAGDLPSTPASTAAPAAPSSTPAAPAAPAQPAKRDTFAADPNSARQREINDRVRAATEKATADAQAEIARLKAQLDDRSAPPRAPAAPTTPAPPPPAPPQAEKFPPFETWAAQDPEHRDWEGYLDARDDFREGQRTKVLQAQQQRDTAARAFHQEAVTYSQRMNDAIKADAGYLESISPELLDLEMPEVAWAQGKPTTVNHDLAYMIRKSELAPTVLRHLSDHPEDLAKLRSVRTYAELTIAFGRLEGRLEAATAPPRQTRSSAPPPPATLGRKPADPTDPIDSAVASGDMAAFKAARLAERAAGLR